MTADNIVLFREYMGTGLILIWFLVSIVYLFLKEEKKEIRILFIYVPIILLLLFFNPIFHKFTIRYMGNDIYYRILWLLPVTIVIAYFCASIYRRLSERKRNIFAVCAAVIIMLSGSYVYGNNYFKKAENMYHIPDSVVHICDAIDIPGREVKAVFPLEMVQYVRQYSPVVCMPYGREMLVQGWDGRFKVLRNIMESDEIEVEKLGKRARVARCLYIILPEDKILNGNLSDEGYYKFYETDGYIIYRNDRYLKYNDTMF